MAITDHFLISNGNKTDIGWFENNSDAMWKWLDAAIFIRYRIVNLTGDRIRGLTFTLYFSSKFEIEYDYNKPKNYEETGELITGDEINQTFLK